ncbi:MAG TPA: BTAD domain-containing putative transcriptional regulator [Acidimicrobiia bacterium]|nr:BTAD domain-containing putative transcriptional regulator [Acidimicrobiia bacterium]
MGLVRFEALGPLTVVDDGDPVHLRPAHRRLAACLLLNPEVWVPVDTLVDRMWGESPPNTARSTLHVHLSALRRKVPGLIQTGGSGYLLDLNGHEFDVPQFSAMAAQAATKLGEGKLREAVDLAGRASALWRGHPFPELVDVEAARGECHRLTELATATNTTLAKALMMQGRVTESIAVLRQLVAGQPLNEALWEELILAYYLGGRQADAIGAFVEVSKVLREELGVRPGPRLRQMEERVLVQDPALMSRATMTVANNLPELDSSFVGRDRDVEGALGLLRRNHLVTITGPPGIGKTRLAIETGVRTNGAFPGGVWLARLAGARVDADVSATIAATMSVTESIESLAHLFRHLSPRPALLILDNCEHLLAAVDAFLDARVRGDRIRVLATSRTRLGARDEVVWPLRALSVPESSDGMWQSDALQLFSDRVARVDPTIILAHTDPDELLEVCRKAGGVPLALEIMARWFPSLDLRSIAGLTLDGAPAPLAADPPHHASVSEAIAWSAALLDAQSREAFHTASTFAGAFAAEAFRTVCVPRADLHDATATLGRLVEASLLVPERSARPGLRYRMLEPLKDFGAARLATDGKDRATRDLHARWFVDSARLLAAAAMNPAEPSAFVEADESIADYRLAMRHLLDTDRPHDAVEIAAGLVQYWIARFLGWEGQRWLDECLGHALDDERRLHALTAAGAVAFYIGQYDLSADLYAEVRDLAVRRGDRRREAQALYGMGRVQVHRRPDEGQVLLTRAVDAFEAEGDLVSAAECRVVIGIQAAYSADSAVAEATLAKAVAVLETAGHRKVASVAHRYLSLVAWHEEDQIRARDHLEVAERLAEESHDRRVLSGVMVQRAMFEGRWGSPARAAAAIIESLRLISGQHRIYFCLTAFGALPILISQGEWSMADRLLKYFDRVYDEYGWVSLDQRHAAAAGYRARVAAALSAGGEEPDQRSVLPSVLEEELIDKLTLIETTSLRRDLAPN